MPKFYVTTSIPYVNSKPHIGFAMELLQADALARYNRQKGNEVWFGTGSDEHGSKILEKATESNMEPKAYADAIVKEFRELETTLNISADTFIRTSDPEHEKRAQEIWKSLEADIYKGTYTGMYCVGCEAFVTEAVAREHGGICPHHQKPYEKINEENYFFKLSKYSAKVKELIEKDELQVLPQTRKHEMLSLLEQGLEDISVSRPSAKIPWGVPVPGDDTQTMYVWFEALMNYVTQLGYPDGENFKKFWPADVHIIGKDILRFHAGIWPGMLLALGQPLPKTIFVHGFITSEGKKMSKSIGNVVSPTEIYQGYGTDSMRYYFLRHIPTFEDGDFSWHKFEDAYNKELGNDLGNLIQRTVTMINKYQSGTIGDIPGPEHDTGPYHEAFEALQIDRAFDYVWTLVRGLNQYIEDEKPWEIAKKGDDEHLKEVLAYLSGSLLQVGSMLWPFMPQTAEVIRRTFEKGIIQDYQGALFPKVENFTGEQPAPPVTPEEAEKADA